MWLLARRVKVQTEKTLNSLYYTIYRLSEKHELFCEAGLMSNMEDFDDFEMAGISWIVSR